jgi:predicted flap endonuclease-1-like 5' DNA nuclease
MKRVARLLSFAAGIAAIIWAMRDRFISLALPREPEPPSFRHPDDHPRVAHQPHRVAPSESTTDSPAPPKVDDLTAIKGIGPVFATKLADIGVRSFSDLAGSSAETIAAGLNTSESRAVDWIRQAGQRP